MLHQVIEPEPVGLSLGITPVFQEEQAKTGTEHVAEGLRGRKEDRAQSEAKLRQLLLRNRGD
jgi:hypothetical protein